MAPKDQKIQQISMIRKRLDRSRLPFSYVDDEVPTQTVKIFSRKKQGTLLDSSSGVTIMGSMEFSGSQYGKKTGTFALRVTRRNFSVGSMVNYNTEVEWKLRHSRLGTLDAIPYFRGTQTSKKANDNGYLNKETLGGPQNPVYVLGPGTIWNYVNVRRGTARVYTGLEGILSIDVK